MATERLSLRIDADLKKSLRHVAIREAVAEADKGIFISQEKMDAWVSSWGTGLERPPPEPDIFPIPCGPAKQ
ncbi:MAG: CopG family transcriptional regulator [Gammaproteobacteria bacterium]|nr:CopG family transcriptional regulator [Gammaproteobacteria bacterium]